MLKTPKSKDVVSNTVTALSLAGGAMASDGVVTLIPAEHRTIGKAAIAGGALIGAAAIKSNSKTAATAKLVLVGMAVMQAVSLVRENVGQSLRQEGDGAVAKAVNGAMGLSCPGGCPSLMFPNTIERVEFNREFIPTQSRQYAEFEDVDAHFNKMPAGI